MRLARIVVRFPMVAREALDRLRTRYFEETGRGLSRASVVRVLVHRTLDGADARRAADVLGEPDRALAPRSASMLATRADPSMRLASCVHPVLDAEKRAMLCTAAATKVRVVEGHPLTFCEPHAAEIDAKKSVEPANVATETMLAG